MHEMLGFDGRVVIVTGSSRGIGKALAAAFAARKAKVVVNGRSRGTVEAAVADIIALGGEAVANVGDVAVEADANALVRQAIQQYGRLDVVVNNAAIMKYVPFLESAETYDAIHDVNLRGMFNVTRAAWPHMVRQSYGRVIIVTSCAVFGALDCENYSSSKGAAIGFLRCLSIEGKPHGINVNGIMPVAHTEMMSVDTVDAGTPIGEQGADMWATAATLLPAKLIAPPVTWFAHESCDLTGEIVHVGGGSVTQVFIAETAGYHDRNLTPEAVRDNWTKICDKTGYTIPTEALDPIRRIMQHVGGEPASRQA